MKEVIIIIKNKISIILGVIITVIIGIFLFSNNKESKPVQMAKADTLKKYMVTAVTTATKVTKTTTITSTNNTSKTTKHTTTTAIPKTTTVIETELPETTTTESIVEDKPIETNEFNIYNLSLSENDLIMMCTVVSNETGYCEDIAQKAVAHTIINRLVSDKFPNDMYSMLTQENQYTAIHSYFDGNYRDGLEPGSEGWNNSMRLCKEALNEADFTGGAFAYYNPDFCGYNDWFEGLTLTYVDQYARFFTW